MRLQSIKFPTKKMKTNNIIPIGGHHLRMPSLTFLVCVAITVLLWVFVTFSREYTVTYDYKVVCSDIPEGRTEAVLSDSTFTLVFKSKGFIEFGEFFNITTQFRSGKEIYRAIAFIQRFFHQF